MTEMQAIPEYYGLRETGVYAADFNGFVDFLVLPLIYAAYSLRRGWDEKRCPASSLGHQHLFSKTGMGGHPSRSRR